MPSLSFLSQDELGGLLRCILLERLVFFVNDQSESQRLMALGMEEFNTFSIENLISIATYQSPLVRTSPISLIKPSSMNIL